MLLKVASDIGLAETRVVRSASSAVRQKRGRGVSFMRSRHAELRVIAPVSLVQTARRGALVELATGFSPLTSDSRLDKSELAFCSSYNHEQGPSEVVREERHARKGHRP